MKLAKREAEAVRGGGGGAARDAQVGDEVDKDATLVDTRPHGVVDARVLLHLGVVQPRPHSKPRQALRDHHHKLVRGKVWGRTPCVGKKDFLTSTSETNLTNVVESNH